MNRVMLEISFRDKKRKHLNMPKNWT